MTGAEITEYAGYLFLAYSTGWASGYLLYVFKRAIDFV